MIDESAVQVGYKSSSVLGPLEPCGEGLEGIRFGSLEKGIEGQEGREGREGIRSAVSE